jgi:hypothetical protein
MLVIVGTGFTSSVSGVDAVMANVAVSSTSTSYAAESEMVSDAMVYVELVAPPIFVPFLRH